jgi:hypothetical protein
MITGTLREDPAGGGVSDTETLLRKLLAVGREGLSDAAVDTVFGAAEELLDELERLRKRDRVFQQVEATLRSLNEAPPTDAELLLQEVAVDGGVFGEGAAELAPSADTHEADTP